MTTASIEAYVAIVDKLPKKRGAVFHTIQTAMSYGLNLRETCVHTGWPINTVSARIHELAERGLIKENGDRNGQTVWVLSRPEEVEQLKEARRKAREEREAKNASEREKRLEARLQTLELASGQLAGYVASLKQDGTPNEPEWVAGVVERVEKVQRILGVIP